VPQLTLWLCCPLLGTNVQEIDAIEDYIRVRGHSPGITIYAGPMTQDALLSLADAWIAHWLAGEGSLEREATAWATDLYRLEYEDPETLWLLILTIHSKDQSRRIQEVLSAGPVESLLVKHGDRFIERIEVQAQQDPKFARLLGGVWMNTMPDSIRQRLQRVWDRRGWDGIPE